MLSTLAAARANFAIAQRAFQADLARQMEVLASLSTRMEDFMCTVDEDKEGEDEDEEDKNEKLVPAGKGQGRAAK